jgi:hypothetical protein
MRQKRGKQAKGSDPDSELEVEQIEAGEESEDSFDLDGYGVPETDDAFVDTALLVEEGADEVERAEDSKAPEAAGVPKEVSKEAEKLKEPKEVEDRGELEDSDLRPAENPKNKPAKPKEPREPFAARAKAVWLALLTRARAVELPGNPDSTKKKAAVVAGIALACLVTGVVTFLIGRSTGANLEQARLEGEAAGRQEGTIEGAARGYAAGFNKAREKAFLDSYLPNYRLNYKRAFEQAGLEVPANDEFEVPKP